MGSSRDAADHLAWEATTRPLAVADWAVGTPVLLAGGVLLWRRAPLGYVAAPGLLLVSGLGGLAFVVAAVLDNLLTGPRTESAVIAMHLIISAVSFALLAFFVRGARPPSSSITACGKIRSNLCGDSSWLPVEKHLVAQRGP